MPNQCDHFGNGGDFIQGMWFCAKCLNKLEFRPVKYRMSNGPLVVFDGKFRSSTQQIPVYSEIAKSGDTTLSMFVRFMAVRLMARTKGAMSISDAEMYAVSLLSDFDEVFGHKDYCWDRGGAHEIIDEDLQHWDDDSGESNS